MENQESEIEISDEDLRAALKEIKAYVDVTEEDLKKIYTIAMRHARERLTPKILVRDVMTKDVVAITGDEDFHEAARLLSERKISGLPVIDGETHVIGLVSEADILSATGMERGHGFKDILRHILGEPLRTSRAGNRVREIMTSPAITTTSDAEVREAAKILNERKIKRLPVVDDRNRLIGIISRADIVRVVGE